MKIDDAILDVLDKTGGPYYIPYHTRFNKSSTTDLI